MAMNKKEQALESARSALQTYMDLVCAETEYDIAQRRSMLASFNQNSLGVLIDNLKIKSTQDGKSKIAPFKILDYFRRLGTDIRELPAVQKSVSKIIHRGAKSRTGFEVSRAQWFQIAWKLPHLEGNSESISQRGSDLKNCLDTLCKINWHVRLGGIAQEIGEEDRGSITFKRYARVPRRIAYVMLVLRSAIEEIQSLGSSGVSPIKFQEIMSVVSQIATEGLEKKRFWGVRSEQTTAVYHLLAASSENMDFEAKCKDNNAIEFRP